MTSETNKESAVRLGRNIVNMKGKPNLNSRPNPNAIPNP